MDLAQSTSSAVAIGDAGTAHAGRAKFAAGVMTGVVITAVLAAALIAGSGSNVGPTTQVDPLVGAAAIEFRAGERVASAATDPLVGAAAIEFRAGERVLTNVATDPLVGPAAIEFRASERQDAAK
jgi:hypothetical protein